MIKVWKSFLLCAGIVGSLLLNGLAVNGQPPVPSKRDLVPVTSAPVGAVLRRVALVIGNKDYVNAPLKNPINDAQSMAAVLKGLGFEVLLKTNVTNREMSEAIDAFAQKLDSGCIGLFYFSGHGVQVDGVNYLIPLGYNIKRQTDVRFEAFPAQRLLDSMGGSGCSLNLVILDACRNNPLPRSMRGAGDKGLEKMDAPSGTLVAYATAPGQTANDGEKSNGLYTGVLLEKMKTPGLKIEEVFKLTRISVKAASGGTQIPWEESSLEKDFYFAGENPMPVIVSGNGSVLDTKGRLTVATNAANAVVTVNEQAAPGGIFTLNMLDDVEKKVLVKITASGYEGQLMNVTLIRGKTVSQPVVLEAVALPNPKNNSKDKSNKESKLETRDEVQVPDSWSGKTFDHYIKVEVTVLASGRTKAVITDGSGVPELDAAVLAAVSRWRYIPAVRDGKPVESTQNVTVHFFKK